MVMLTALLIAVTILAGMFAVTALAEHLSRRQFNRRASDERCPRCAARFGAEAAKTARNYFECRFGSAEIDIDPHPSGPPLYEWPSWVLECGKCGMRSEFGYRGALMGPFDESCREVVSS